MNFDATIQMLSQRIRSFLISVRTTALAELPRQKRWRRMESGCLRFEERLPSLL
jgi:hypothetical protein